MKKRTNPLFIMHEILVSSYQKYKFPEIRFPLSKYYIHLVYDPLYIVYCAHRNLQ